MTDAHRVVALAQQLAARDGVCVGALWAAGPTTIINGVHLVALRDSYVAKAEAMVYGGAMAPMPDMILLKQLAGVPSVPGARSRSSKSRRGHAARTIRCPST